MIIEHSLAKAGISLTPLSSVALVAVGGVLAWQVWKDRRLIRAEQQHTEKLEHNLQDLTAEHQQLSDKHQQLSDLVSQLQTRLSGITSAIASTASSLVPEELPATAPSTTRSSGKLAVLRKLIEENLKLRQS